jgi:hypothetical protein
MSTVGKLKENPDDENETRDLRRFRDSGRCHVTALITFPPEVALVVVNSLSDIVQRAHASTVALSPDDNGIIRAQTFEEGEVYMLASPFDGYFADRYLMDFYDVDDRDFCSRMHLHTGLRFVRMMTGPGTRIRVSSLSPFEVTDVAGVTTLRPVTFTDEVPEAPGGERVRRYNLLVEENSWVDMQIPRGVSHQFNAIGPNAVIDSVHPEESVETFREKMSGYKMMAQTIFLAEKLPPAATCNTFPARETS